MVTIADVAVRAGVGTGTVSRVINNSPKVRPETRERVLAAIEELDYQPNPVARALSRGRSQTVGVVIASVTQPSAVERLRGVVAAVDGSRYDLVLFNVESPIHRDEHFATLTRRDRADGLLVVSLPPPPRRLAHLVASCVPVVLVDARGAGVPAIVTDDVEGGRLATTHLVDLGHRRIAFIGDQPHQPLEFESSGNRERGYREVLEAEGIDVDENLIRYCPHNTEASRQQAEMLLSRRGRPTAIFASSDVQALGVLEAARSAGIDVPDGLSVVGFDDIDIAVHAGITTVRQPLFDSGFLGASLLLAQLAGWLHTEPAVRQLPLELIERSTTGPLKPGARRPAVVTGGT